MQSGSVFDRADNLLKSSNAIDAPFTIEIVGLGKGTGHFWFKKPNYQRMTMVTGPASEELVQNDTATVLFDRAGQEYSWYPPSEIVMQAPPEANNFTHYGLPTILSQGNLSSIAAKDKWAVAGQEKIQGKTTDVLALVQPDVALRNSPLKLWIDPLGRILKIRSTHMAEGMALIVISDFNDPKYTATSSTSFDFNIPDGYMPSSTPKPFTTVSTGDEIELAKVVKWPSGEPTTFDSKTASKPRVALFSSNDTFDESSEDWSGLYEDVKKAGVEFVQIWIGVQPPKQNVKWPVFWDKDGANERGLGLPATPYVLGLKGTTVMSGWQGTAADAGREATKAILGPLKEQ